MIHRIMDFVENIRAEKLLKAAGIFLLIIGILDAATVIFYYVLHISIGGGYAPDWKMMLLDWIIPAVELVAGSLAFYFIRCPEKHLWASVMAMIMVLLSTFMANLFSDFVTKIFIYIALIPAYLYLFGATKLRERAKYKNYEKYKLFYEQNCKEN